MYNDQSERKSARQFNNTQKRDTLGTGEEGVLLEIDRLPNDLPIHAYEELERKWIEFHDSLKQKLADLDDKAVAIKDGTGWSVPAEKRLRGA
jgi:hypothetical protein